MFIYTCAIITVHTFHKLLLASSVTKHEAYYLCVDYSVFDILLAKNKHCEKLLSMPKVLCVAKNIIF